MTQALVRSAGVVYGCVALILATQLPQREMYMLPSDVPAHGYPLADETVSVPLLFAISYLLPLLVYFTLACRGKVTRTELSALLVSAIITLLWDEAVTELLKKTAGRPRPDFFGRCIGNNNLPPVADKIRWISPGYPKCERNAAMSQAYLSFPSGHSSTAFSGLSQLTFFLIARFGVFSGSTSGLQYMVAFSPLVVATWIATTRVIDMWHFATDVVGGGIIGFATSVTVWKSQFVAVPRERAYEEVDQIELGCSLSGEN
eukprot:TRINITY_DN27029_c0_g2_i1.p1 TRINITY_DN27029_c0_g2~~TRINITY_DN27029_c0_g2_i1.p1  ORF type:complete len:259 (-),score=15.52 TRINITY_DN27029_c0_g2_i1:318-1094(-)